MHYVYVLKCGDSKLYTGYTSDLKKRLRRHENAEVPSTKTRLPVRLVFYEALLSPKDARRREAHLKSTAGKRALRLMLREWLRQAKA